MPLRRMPHGTCLLHAVLPEGTTMSNERFPGLPDYSGPTKGWFTLLHHQGPHFEYSDDVTERIDYINANKPGNEIAIRLRHIVFVSAEKPAAWAEYQRVEAPALAEYQRVTAQALAVLDAELQRLIPDCR